MSAAYRQSTRPSPSDPRGTRGSRERSAGRLETRARNTPDAGRQPATQACARCLRRAWLLARCGVRLDYRSRDLARFWQLLALPDEQLIDAIGGRRRAELHAAYEEFDHTQIEHNVHAQTICRHHPAYPRRLRDSTLAPHALSVAGDLARLGAALGETVVVITGTRRATDYGMEVARSIARGLAAAGMTIAGGLSEGIALAAHSGAMEAGGATVTVMAGGPDKCSPAVCSPVYRRLVADGCAISELPWGERARRWSALARARTLVLLAGLVIVVEADSNPWELACANLARGLGVPVAAVPGRVSSPASRGSNELIINGAPLVRGPQDVLDVVFGAGARTIGEPRERLEPRLVRTLEHLGAGRDTLERLTATGAPRDEILTALLELELLGLVARGDGGRYVPCGALPTG